MELTTDIILQGTAWNTAIEKLSNIFSTRTNYSIFLLCTAIGIMYDKRISKPEENGEETKNVPRNVLQNNDNGKLDFMYQAAILTTLTENITEEQRLELAFGDDEKDNNNQNKNGNKKMALLVEFANYGVTELVKYIGETQLESMDNIKDFLESTVEGRNFDIDALPDDVLLDDE